MIPPTRYIDAGPGVPLANPNSATLQGKAYANLGETVQQVGAMGFGIAERIRKIDEGGKMAALEASMNEDAAKFSIELMTREDTANWPGEWKERSGKWLDQAKQQGLSPEGMARFNERFTQWNTQRSIGFEVTAATKAIELGRARISNAFDYYMGQEDYGAAERVLMDGGESGTYSSGEVEKGRNYVASESRRTGTAADIDENARGWLAANEADKPPEGYEPDKWRQAHDYAVKVAAQQDDKNSADMLDKIVSKQVTTHEEIIKGTKGMRPLGQKKLLDAMDRWNAEGAQAARENPENIAANVGKFYAGLKDWTPDPEGEDPNGVELRYIMEQVPEGHPERDKMRESYGARKARQADEIKTRADQGLDVLKQAAERGEYGPVKPPTADKVETRVAVEKGFLKDVPKMQALGFSKSDAENIREAADKDQALGQAKFKELWKGKRQGSVNAAPFDIATADALLNGNGHLQWDATIPPEKMAAHEAAVNTYGKNILEWNNWIRLNPNANEDAMKGKLRELGSSSARLSPTSGVVRPAPSRQTATSMEIPKDGIKLSNYGYPSDTTPDSNSANGIGHRDNKLIAGKSAAITKSLADRLDLKHGDEMTVETTQGNFNVFYHDTVPSTDKRTGDLPETIDIYRPEEGSNSWGGRVTKISKVK